MYPFSLNSKHHVGAKVFKETNWLPTNKRVEQHDVTKFFKYWKGTSQLYENELFVSSRNTNKTR